MAPQGAGVRAISRLCVEPPRWASDDLVIRRYERGDHDAVLALHRTALAEVGLRPGDGIYYDDDFDRLEEIYLRDGRGDFLVGELRHAAGDLVAMGGLRPAPERSDDSVAYEDSGGPVAEPGPVAEMVRLRVHPRVQCQGLGTVMLLVLEERARELGYRVLRGDTTERQRAALSLYRGFGWREIGRRSIGGTVNIYGEKILH